MFRLSSCKIYTLLMIVLFVSQQVNANIVNNRYLNLTLEDAVKIAMKNSYRIRQLKLGIERTKLLLKAERAELKSKIYMNLKAPEIQALSEYQWNSELYREEVVRRNTRLWQMEFSISQPVIIFGYPTNGYLSFNSKLYRYLQKNGNNDVSYYNRYFIEYVQPLFQPNILKNNLEKARLDLQQAELNYLQDIMDLLDSVSDSFFDLFYLTYMDQIHRNYLLNLKQAKHNVQQIVNHDPTRKIEKNQIEIELANARENLLQNQSNIRREIIQLKNRLGLNNLDTLGVSTKIFFIPLKIDTNKAIELAYRFNPQIRLLSNRRKQNEIEVENVKGENGINVNLDLTYGIEKQDDDYRYLWQESDNSYSVTLNAYIPLWDWGQRKARIEAARINLKRTDLYIKETKERIRTEIINIISNLEEYQRRVQNMQKNIQIAKNITLQSKEQYLLKKISLQDLLRIISSQKETETNFLKVYINYRKNLVQLMQKTYYDFENDRDLIEQFKINSS